MKLKDHLWVSIEVFVVVVVTEGAAGGRCQWCFDGGKNLPGL